MYVQLSKPHQYYVHPISIIISIHLLLLINIPFHHANDDYGKYYSDCNKSTPFKCGDTTLRLKYPFWVENSGPSYCGLEGFKLSCERNEIPVIDIGSDNKYRVLKIDPIASAITLERYDDHLEDGTCAPIHKTTILNSKLFEYGLSVEDLYMFYGCPLELPVTIGIRNNITCKSGDMDGQVIFGVQTLLQDYLVTLNKSCKILLKVPVNRTDCERFSMNETPLQELLDSSFVVHYIINKTACSNCLHKPENKTKDSGSSDTKASGRRNIEASGKKIGIAFGAAGGGVLLLLLVLLILYRRKKAKHASPLDSPNVSSYSISMSDSGKEGTYMGVPTFSYNELEKATNNFDSGNELGNGAFGTVYKGKLRDGREVAVKRLYENNLKRVEQFMNEIVILARLHHPNLVVLYGGTSHQCRKLLLVYEYIPNGTVADHLHGESVEPGSLTWKTRMSIAIETASALSYLHVSDVIHRDVKTTNILLDNNFRVKVADFGLSRLFPMNVTHVSTVPQGTPGYVDPEYRQCYQLTDKSDVYSFGVVLIELISSKPAVDISRHRHEINLANLAINKIQGDALHELVDPTLGFESDHQVRNMITDVAELASRCLQNEREMRPSMEEVHKSLKEIQRKYCGEKK